jgi:hypothetical protein
MADGRQEREDSHPSYGVINGWNAWSFNEIVEKAS